MNLLVRTGAGRLRDSKIRRSGAQGDFGGGRFTHPLTQWANVFRTSGAGKSRFLAPLSPRSPRVRLQIVAGEVGGLVGVALAFVFELLGVGAEGSGHLGFCCLGCW